MSAVAPTEREVLTPSRLNALVRALLEDAFPLVWVEGEISGLSRPASGHLYFSLKDAAAQVRCAMFRTRASYLRARPADGMKVLVRARVGLYEPRGEFQLIVEHLEEAGEGALRRAFEALKAKLHAEGLFEAARKRPLPRFVRRLAVLTSPSGAAVRDVLSVLARRWPLVEIDVVPVPVQGAEAPTAIRDQLERVARAGRHDVILLTRGGGSIEDLAAFNDEALARAIAASPVPVVSAVGHEIDFTIADFVADLRAPTPSAAAELLVPDRDDLAHRIDLAQRRATRAVERRLEAHGQSLDLLAARLRAAHPGVRIAALRAALGRGALRLARAAERGLEARTRMLATLAARLQANHPGARIARIRSRLAPSIRRLDRAIAQALEVRSRRLDRLAARLGASHPGTRLGHRRADLAALGLRLEHAFGRRLDELERRLEIAGRRLRAAHPADLIAARRGALVRLRQGLDRAALWRLRSARGRLLALGRTLEAVGPRATLARGYAIVLDRGNRALLRDAAAARPGQPVLIRFASGEVPATIDPVRDAPE